MVIPADLRRAIDDVFDEVPLGSTAKRSRELRERYRSGSSADGFVRSDADTLAYAGSRLPGTFAAVRFVLEELRARRPDLRVRSLLDVGAGPGGGAAAAVTVFPEIESATLLEGDPRMMALGRRILGQLDSPVLRRAEYVRSELRRDWDAAPCDLVIASYVIRELPESDREPFVDRLWRSATAAVCCIEPGKSPVGHDIVRRARDRFAAGGAAILAPCGALAGCGRRKNGWCHFGQRVERSRTQRRLKDAVRSYEDEKFAYVIASRAPGEPAPARVALPPRLTGAGVLLEICTGDDRAAWLVRKRDRDAYAWARRTWWGDAVPPGLRPS